MFPASNRRGLSPGFPLLLATLALVAPDASHATPAPLTLDEALRRTRASHPLLLAARHEVAGSRALERDARRGPQPGLTATLENFGGGLDADRSEATLTLERMLELGGDGSARRAEAEAGTRLATAEQELLLNELEAATVEAFCSAWLAEQRSVRLRDAVSDADAATRAAAERLRVGAAPAHEELRARADRAVRVAELRQAERDLALARSALTRHWSAPADEVGTVELPEVGDYAPPDWAALAARVGTQPEARQRAAERLRAESALRSARARRVPDLTLAAGARHLAEVPGTGFVASVSLPLPTPGTGRGAVEAANASRSAAESRADATTARLLDAARSARERVAAAIAGRRELREQALPAAEAALRALTEGFRAGRFSYLEVQSGQRGLLEARLLDLELTAEVWRSRLELERWMSPPAERDGTGGSR